MSVPAVARTAMLGTFNMSVAGGILGRVMFGLGIAIALPGPAKEYEIEGVVRQKIIAQGGSSLDLTNDFTIYVRDRGWLIRTTEGAGTGSLGQREVGSPDGKTIYDTGMVLQREKNLAVGGRPNIQQVMISGNGVPVELSDRGVNGHLWLMFASQWYWAGLRTNRITPAFDWHASVGANPNLKVEAGWRLMGEPNSLPMEVWYLGRWDETNGLYKITGTNFVGGTAIPSGFTFEERYAAGYGAGMVLRKRVEAEVRSARATCSREKLVPGLPSNAVVVDWRLRSPESGNSVPTYTVPDKANWPSTDEGRRTLEANAKRQQEDVGHAASQQAAGLRKVPTAIVLTACCLLAPAAILLVWRKAVKARSRS
jgi:hypothetical protein